MKRKLQKLKLLTIKIVMNCESPSNEGLQEEDCRGRRSAGLK
jgi:hypothetical protein